MSDTSYLLWLAFGAVWAVLSIEYDCGRYKTAFYLASALGVSALLLRCSWWMRSHPDISLFSRAFGIAFVPIVITLALGCALGVLMRRLVRSW
jgi:hypothetical protein